VRTLLAAPARERLERIARVAFDATRERNADES
jgi:hypothetical protein